jgi:hypothetical protein
MRVSVVCGSYVGYCIIYLYQVGGATRPHTYTTIYRRQKYLRYEHPLLASRILFSMPEDDNDTRSTYHQAAVLSVM